MDWEMLDDFYRNVQVTERPMTDDEIAQVFNIPPQWALVPKE